MSKKDPWKDVELPDEWDPESNRYLNPPKPSVLEFIIDPRLADNEAEKTQDEWIEYFSPFTQLAGEGEDLSKALQSADRISNTDQRAEVYTTIAAAQVRAGMFDEAMKIAEKISNIGLRTGVHTMIRNAQEGQVPEARVRYFASMADYYAEFRKIAFNLEAGGAQILQGVLLKLFRDNEIITSTRVRYDPNSLGAEITHNIGTDRERVIPVEAPELHEKLIRTITYPGGISYLQALFDTQDDGETIANVITTTFGTDRDSVTLWTPSSLSRRDDSPMRVCSFLYNPAKDIRIVPNEDLKISTTRELKERGYAFGVVYKAEEGSQDG